MRTGDPVFQNHPDKHTFIIFVIQMLSIRPKLRGTLAIGLSLLFLVPCLWRTLHQYHAADHVRIHHCDSDQKQQQHLHDPRVLDWHHCHLCTVPAPVDSPVAVLLPTHPARYTTTTPAFFAADRPLLPLRRSLTVRGPPRFS